MSTAEMHRQITAEELAHTFEEEAVPKVDLGVYAFEDWVTLVMFWVMALAVFLQFFTRYVLNDCYAWTEEIATNCLIGVVFIGSAMCVRLSGTSRSTCSTATCRSAWRARWRPRST